jgi:hypothetical protein
VNDALTWDDVRVLVASAALVMTLLAVRFGMRRRRRHLRLPRDRLG